ncbi:MAG: sugar ABC transporter permease [Clostridiales bacterium]|nr:sugar ABC transporter permease [Clostridiales bacterium]
MKAFFNSESVAGHVCAAPFMLGFVAFFVVPMITSLYYSFCNYNIVSPPVWVGLKNFADIFKDPVFYKSLQVTFSFAIASVPMKLLFALAVALILIKGTRLTAFYRAVYYLPSILGSSVAVAILWKRMFSVDGLVNRVLGLRIAWIGDTRTALWVLIILAVWQFGSSMLIFLSSMKQIPSELYEAARVDGAGSVRAFFRITLPMLTPTIFFNLVMQFINGLLVFAQGQIISDGKPMNSTMFYVLHMYQQSFRFGKVGMAAAMGWILLIVVAALTFILFKTRKRWVYDY